MQGVCHADRQRVLQRVREAELALQHALLVAPHDPEAIRLAEEEVVAAGSALARIPDCSE